MNYKYFSAWLSLMCLVSPIRTWKWLDVSALNAALEDEYQGEFVFSGYDVDQLGASGRLKICGNATTNPYPMFNKQYKVKEANVTDLEISVTYQSLNDARVTKRAFLCATQGDEAFYYGQGPYEKSIAVYMRFKNGVACPQGIMYFV